MFTKDLNNPNALLVEELFLLGIIPEKHEVIREGEMGRFIFKDADMKKIWKYKPQWNGVVILPPPQAQNIGLTETSLEQYNGLN